MNENAISIDVEFSYTPIVNFAMQQNHVSTIKKLLIQNNGTSALKDITIEVFSEPEFTIAWSKKIDSLGPNELFDAGIVNLKISTKFLSELTERIAGVFNLIIKNGQNIIYKEYFDIDILAFDQWGGVNILPEILASFITPNHPQIPKIIKRASEILEKWTGIPSFDEYQTQNPDRVKKQMAAIYEAIAERKIVYCSVPASFELDGQRVRLTDAILSQQLGNCLDMSLFYSACLEAVGLNAFVVIIKGHAFTGAWLINESFADSINDDPSLLTKRIADGINEITVVEATCMNAGNTISFDEAIVHAKNKLIKTDDFVLFLDVKRARFSGIRPLPLRVKTDEGWNIIQTNFTGINRESSIPQEITNIVKIKDTDVVEASKQQIWERKLLDLSLRNNLLNLRITKGTIQFISTDLNKLEDKLASNQEFQILPKPTDWDNPLRNSGVYQLINQTDPIIDLVRHELSQQKIRAYLTENELNNSLTNVFRASKLSLEENGANTLYITLGLLKWYESNVSERPRFAPILLLPIEIVRKSALKGYVIRSREEETVINITLLEMLRQDFGIHIGGLDPLPKDDSGVDVRLIFNTIRQAIMSQSRWDVEEQAFLGNFSFSKFIMWNDIHSNANKFKENKVVSSLISGKLEWEVNADITEAKHFDESYHPSEIALPISADSSQLAAVCAATENNSFVLHGPPGTGKSQTITNIIANALYKGKNVLFVAEKMAALAVVQSRLESIGIGAFCLELHSNKSKKSTVLEQLKKSTEVLKTNSSQDFELQAERINLLRKELNNYVNALHKQYPFGYSLYDIFNEYAKYKDGLDNIHFNEKTIEQLTKEKLAIWDDLVAELKIAGNICNHPYNNPLKEIGIKQYSQSLKNEAQSVLESYINKLKTLKEVYNNVSEIIGISITSKNKTYLQQVQKICELLINLPNTPSNILQTDNIELTIKQIIALTEHGLKRDEFRKELLNIYRKEILKFEAGKHLQEWNIASRKWFFPKFLHQNRIAKLMKSVSLTGSVEKNSIPEYLNKIISHQKEQNVLDENTLLLTSSLGFLWKDDNCDWENIQMVCKSLKTLNEEIILLLKNITSAKEWRDKMATQFTVGSQAYLSIHNKTLKQYCTILDAVITTENKLSEILAIDITSLGDNKNDDFIENRLVFAQRLFENIDGLKDWITWLQVKDKCVRAELLPAINAYEQNFVDENNLIDSYKKGLCLSLANYIFDKEPYLSSFNSLLFEDKIIKFKEISNQFEQLTKDELYTRLAVKIPSITQEAAQSSEIGILQRALRNGGRGISIRKLFDSIPNLLPRLAPCMLMSPISVAQYLDVATNHFDLVIFDEASQMPTCEAIGAIARGNNVIVVGDPKQMPPTSFFSSQNVDEDNLQEDQESILEDCLALSMPSSRLLWHYRSKHESLIAFSNSQYYENKLLTFPSPDDITSKVTFVPIPGYYDRAKTRQNIFEAEAIIDEIIHRLSDPVLSKQSIGVVTFSSVQQTLIDDLLAEKLKEMPDLDAILMAAKEPLFIKNLENVQGDERDVILFSVGYGPDKEGRVSLNFGPINRTGGERRLNVAFSRARYEMKVFSTLHADQIDIARTSSEGVAGLKAFLEYAEKGRSALPGRNKNKTFNTSAFINLIAAEINQRGYDVHTNIGCSGYKIDIGVINPENQTEYILGVLCDGYNYYSALTAKDREIIQIDVLKMLGWNIYKIWSTDWWENKDEVIEKLITAIENTTESISNHEKDAALPKIEMTDPKPVEDKAPVLLNNAATITTQPAVLNKNVREYKMCSIDIVLTTSSDDFLQLHNQPKIRQQIVEVIKTEAPIRKDLLCRRVLTAWGITRIGTRIAAQFDVLFKQLQLQHTGKGATTTFWHQGQDPNTYPYYRVHADDVDKRDADDIPYEEIANAMGEILANQISLHKDELIRETARTFGFSRLGNNVTAAMDKGLVCAIERGYAIQENERIVCKQ